MSSDPFNKDSAPAFGGSPDMGAGQPQQEHQRPYDNTGGAHNNFVNNIPSQPAQNQYNMGQNQSNPEPNLGQNNIPSPSNNYMSGSGALGGNNINNQYQQPSGQILGQNHTQGNPPPIGQNNYGSYPPQQTPQNYSQAIPSIGQDVGQKLDSGINSGMGQNYNQPGQMSSLPPVGMNSGGNSYQNNQGERTYEPGMTNPYANAAPGTAEGIDRGLPLSPESMKEFEEKSARCSQYKQTDVFPAILLKSEDDSLRVVEHLKNKGVSMIAKDTLDQTALFYAAREGKLRIVTLLLENGCDPNHRDCYGQTCMYYAARENRIDVAQKLIEAGAELNNEDMHKQSCLFYAAKQGNIDMCAKLIDSGANLNHTDNKNQTALHWAQKSRKADTVDFLITRGANPIARKDNNKKRPPMKKKPANERKEPKKYVLTVFKNGHWLPLCDEDFEALEKECPEVSQIIKDPQHLEKLEIPDIPEDIPIYDHWEKPAKRIINNLWKHESAWLFHFPVDVKAWGIEDYYNIVTKPMDFTTIKCKLSNNEYKMVDEFVQDVHQVFDNCILYNGEANQYSLVAKKMRKEFESQFKGLSMDFYKK